MVPKLYEEDNWIDRVKNESLVYGVMGENYISYTVKQRKTNWMSHIQRRNFLLKYVLELRDGKIGRMC